MGYYKEDFTMTMHDYKKYVEISKKHNLPILKRHHNMTYKVICSLCDTFVLVYSYETLVGFISQNDRVFYEWGHTEKYSTTTSRQLTILAHEIVYYNSMFYVRIISITDGKTLLGSGIWDKYCDYYN